ncbi:phosphoenolpyruvate--protein phosphotransferase [Nocardioides anomalus]|uniref:Phosphoenolpyruvate-protein phosphotransferase n=1 Tax=Nocardioides anomalus TaxID=2712223 RepID=A0A6G6WBM4_9ACTN|nr:phosphoenolpyruvate--protein phosphotransferase [Nocardioides anomalus]QIG42440.1 phosphoenolpyruvate--protein phosphotransferase [Nocardioides anomalus]
MVTDSSPSVLRGTPVVPGLAFGPVVLVAQEVSSAAIEAYGDGPGDSEAAMAAYDEAAAAVAEGFSAKAARASGAATEVLTASAGLTRDKGLRQAVAQRVDGGTSLLDAVHAGVAQFVDVFTAMGGLMAERATDLRDIERRLVARLVGEPEPGVTTPGEPSVLVAHDLAPADTAGLDPAVVLALVTEKGGATSHTAIIARQLGIPCVVGVADALTLSGSVLVDGTAGTVDPTADPSAAADLVARDRESRAALDSWTGPATTTDGVHVKLLANVADGPSARTASEAPVEGVGLFRTELCFLDRRDEPSVDEQAKIYGEVLDAFTGEDRYVVVRTLDAGSDKPIAFATLEDEENPALGVRGLRLAVHNPGLLQRQLDGIAAAAQATGAETWVMAPMVATVAEAGDFAAAVRERGLKAGIMVEVPSAALLADRMLEVVDFLSIGTNDLTQYAMAADRLASDLAHLTDPWQPAVLQLIATTAAAGQRADKPVGVCGEAAADPLLAVALVGMGITSLSMAPAAVRAVGAQLSAVSTETCRKAAEAALAAADPMAGRDAVRALLG